MGSLKTYTHVILMPGLHLFVESQMLHIHSFLFSILFYFLVFILPRYPYSLLFHDYFLFFNI